MRTINELIWHCAATPEGKDFTVADIDRWHKERGWSGIGYHFVVYLDGSVHDGRPVEKIGAHVSGHNTNTIGACYIGGVDGNKNGKDTRTPEQKAAMRQLTIDLIAKYKLTKISGHRDYAAKACPCFEAGDYNILLPEQRAATSIVRHGDKGWRVRAIQSRLLDLGYALRVDGHFGNGTRNAVLAFQADEEIKTDGIVGASTQSALNTAVSQDAGARGAADAEDLRGASRIVGGADVVESSAKWGIGGLFTAKAAGATGALEFASSVADQGSQVQGLVGSFQGLTDFASEHWFWILIIVAGVFIWQARKIRDSRVEDHRSGKTV